MTLEWLPRDDQIKDHALIGSEHWGTDAPCTIYEKRPVLDKAGNPVDGLYTAWVILNNPRQYNSYNTEMVKGVIAGFQAASSDRSVVAIIFTAVGDRSFCTGGNTKEYAEYYSKRPNEYGEYMDLFNGMVDAILNCKKPTICRVNGMRVAGGQEIGMACDLAISSDLAIFGPGRRLHRFPALDALHRGRHVELHLLRDVELVQDEGQGPDHQGGSGAQGGREFRPQPAGDHRPLHR